MRQKILYTMLIIVGTFFFTSCEKDAIGGTATEKMAGEWYVTAVAIDEDGNVVYEDADLFALGNFHLDTYNTASNSTDSMWVCDNGTLWDFKVKAKINLDSLTFRGNDLQNEAYDSHVTITNGKILYGAATTPSGVAADSIVFTVSFDDDSYPATYGYAAYRVSGYRYTGFTNDD
jgi:hypothetical protein